VAYLQQAPRDATSKFGPRALHDNFVGDSSSGIFENGQLRHTLGYVLLVTADNVTTVSRHVLFNESIIADNTSSSVHFSGNNPITNTSGFLDDDQIAADRAAYEGEGEDVNDDPPPLNQDSNSDDDDAPPPPRTASPTSSSKPSSEPSSESSSLPIVRPTGDLRVGLRQEPRHNYTAYVVLLAANVPTPESFKDAMAGNYKND